jgi:RecB family exonuclease
MRPDLPWNALSRQDTDRGGIEAPSPSTIQCVGSGTNLRVHNYGEARRDHTDVNIKQSPHAFDRLQEKLRHAELGKRAPLRRQVLCPYAVVHEARGCLAKTLTQLL